MRPALANYLVEQTIIHSPFMFRAIIVAAMKHMTLRSSALAILLLSTSLTAPAFAKEANEAQPSEQTDPAAESGSEQAKDLPWLYQGSDIPVDDSWKFGVLPNGVRYAVKNNGVPPGQVAIRIAVDVGSLHEKDNELGYAHLLEHLLFRESKYVPDGEAKRIWQRFGATFGSDTNAQTSPTQTVYKLDLPNVTPENLDESMKILSGMIAYPKFTQKGVDAEKQVVIAEKRESEGPRMDMIMAANEHFYRGQRLAIRPVIGTNETLMAATPKSVGAFHARWYRPENIVISIAGDLPPEEMEALVVKHFGDWKVKGKPEAAPDFGDPVAVGPDVKLIVDPTQPMMIVWTITRPWRPVRDTFAYNEQNMADDLALSVINRRLEATARRGGSFLAAGISNGKVSRSAEVTQMTILPADNDWQSALNEARAFVADAKATPPSQADIDREVADYANAIKTSVDSYPFEAGADAADSIASAVDIRETVATPMVVQQFFTDAIPRFTPDRLFASTDRMFEGTTSRILVVSPVPIEGGEEAIAAAFAAPIQATGAVRVEQKSIGFDALPALGAPGKVVSESQIGPGGLTLTRIEFENGVTALLFPNNGEAQKIKVRVRFGKGYQAFDASKPNFLWSGSMALVGSGVGDLGLEELDQLISGKRIGFQFGVDYDAFEFSADTRPSDLKGQLHLFAAKLFQPRWDAAPVERGKRQMIADYPAFTDSASSVLARDMPQLLAGGDTRYLTPTPEEIASLTPEAFRATWEPILATGPIEVMLFGDFQTPEAIETLAETFGALPKRPDAVVATGAADMGFAAPSKDAVTRYHDGAKDQAAAVIAWPTGAGVSDIREKRKLEILSDIFRDRLFETFRAEEGASYSPYATTEWPENMRSGGYFIVISQIQPGKVDAFFTTAESIALDLATNPITPDELDRVVKPKMQWIDRASTGNAFWMNEMEGMTRDREGRFRALRSLLFDYEDITPEELQEAAQRYLTPDSSWRMQILPQPNR